MANKKYNDNNIDTSDGIFVHVSFLYRLYLGTSLPRVFDIYDHQNVYRYKHGAWNNHSNTRPGVRSFQYVNTQYIIDMHREIPSNQ
jgi:hypothetical protein